MKRVIVASTAKRFAIIRMCLNNKSAARHLNSSVSNDMLKLKFNNLTDVEALQVAVALAKLNDFEAILEFGTTLSESELSELISRSGTASESEAVSYLSNQDVGSGEAITFTVRNNGSLIYSSGLQEKYFGRMPSQFSNEEDPEPDINQMQDEFVAKLDKLCNDLSLQHTEVRFKGPSGRYPYSFPEGKSGFLEDGVVYRVVPTFDGRVVALILTTFGGCDYLFDSYSDESLNALYENLRRRVNRACKQYKDVKRLRLVDPIEIDPMPVFRVAENSDPSIDADFQVSGLAYKSNLRKALESNDPLVAIVD